MTRRDRNRVLRFLNGGSPEEIERFKREAQTAAEISHPNVAAVYEIGEHDRRPFLAMQFIAGSTLRTFPRTDRRQLVRLVRDAARAVHAAHARGIVHRDFKPENLLEEHEVNGGDGVLAPRRSCERTPIPTRRSKSP